MSLGERASDQKHSLITSVESDFVAVRSEFSELSDKIERWLFSGRNGVAAQDADDDPASGD